MSVPAGTVIAGYTVERVLGSGGMGTVYLARHPVLPRSDALKVLAAELSADAEFAARFQREADLAATLDHPNIVRVYSRGETEQRQLWITMQFIDGTDAGAVLKHGGRLDPERAAHITGQVARALDYAHARGVLHRDLKPANFLLSGPVGPRERVLLADFGIARALHDATRLTATGELVTTVAYAAPELLESKPADHRADVYSLGCALYRMLTNKAPYAGSMSAVMLAHIMDPIPRPTDLVSDLPPAIDDVIATAMAKDPAARFPSAGQFATAAADALGHPETTITVAPLPAPDETTVVLRGGTPAARNPAAPQPQRPTTPPTVPFPPTPANPFNVSPAAPPNPFDGVSPTAPTQPRPPGTTARRKRRWIWAAAAAVIALVAAGTIAAVRYTSAPTLPPYTPQTFTHAFGTTTINQRPTAVAAAALWDADAVLSMGVQPVALTAGLEQPPSWLAAMIQGHPSVVKHGDFAAISAAKPGVIIDTAVNEATYQKLAAIAPTVAQPNDSKEPFTPAVHTEWIGRILGLPDAAKRLNDQAAIDTADVRQHNARLAGKSVVALRFTDSGLSAMTTDSVAAAYLNGLGMTYDAKLAAPEPGVVETPIDTSSMFGFKDDVFIVIRTDKAAAGGGYVGLPKELIYSGGDTIVVDAPDTVAALASGGPAATRYLNGNFAHQLADKIS
jgi:eukaryotic-like serine/threonine-protein kinase